MGLNVLPTLVVVHKETDVVIYHLTSEVQVIVLQEQILVMEEVLKNYLFIIIWIILQMLVRVNLLLTRKQELMPLFQ